MLDRFRATGADLPPGHPLRAHGVATEGYLWRFTDPERGRALMASVSINRADDSHWALVTLAAYPNGVQRSVVHTAGVADPDGFGVTAGNVFRADTGHVRAELGPDTSLDVRITDPQSWDRAPVGARLFETIPGLNRYWHPWLFGGTVTGEAVLDGTRVPLDGARVYSEKHWGKGRFPDYWWWGHAQGFAEPHACVSFAGGAVPGTALHREVTYVVVRLPDGRVRRIGDPVVSGIRARVSEDRWSLHGRSPRIGITIEGLATLADARMLRHPLPDEQRSVPGSVIHQAGSLHVVVRHRSTVVWTGESPLAALEYGSIDRVSAALDAHAQR